MSKYVKPEGTWIYFLSGPDGVVRYVGKAVDPKGRLAEHLRNASLRSRRPSRLWVAKLLRDGHKPAMTLVEFCHGDGCAEEMHHIRLARADGLPLNNATEGGEGAFGYKHTPEALAKMSAAHKGHVWTAEARAKSSATHKLIKRTPEWRRRIGEAHRGKTLTQEHKEAVSRAQRGRKHTAEEIEKRAAKRRGVPLSSEHRAAVSAAKRAKGFHHTDQAKAAMSVAKKGVKLGPQTPEHTARLRAGRILVGGDPGARRAAMAEILRRQDELGWTPKQAANACGVHPAVYSNWKTGKRLPTLESIGKARPAFGLRSDPGRNDCA